MMGPDGRRKKIPGITEDTCRLFVAEAAVRALYAGSSNLVSIPSTIRTVLVWALVSPHCTGFCDFSPSFHYI